MPDPQGNRRIEAQALIDELQLGFVQASGGVFGEATLVLIAALGACKKDDPCPDWLLGYQQKYDSAVSATISQQNAGLMSAAQMEVRLGELKANAQAAQQAEHCCCLYL